MCQPTNSICLYPAEREGDREREGAAERRGEAARLPPLKTMRAASVLQFLPVYSVFAASVQHSLTPEAQSLIYWRLNDITYQRSIEALTGHQCEGRRQ